ncbi:DoxX family protein [Galbibacter marinus]|uniref:DoxX family protein n=1 Tax=Galbibacter marinus TaxID=555500 RepID=K2PYD9_9FLAO|nr:DoxX family protein [Galbibacter marinus]EKF56469.1 DoxX family protein [Galbibacter marinus]
MNKIFSVSRSASSVDLALLIARVGIGALMLVHGISKIPMLDQSPIQFYDFMGVGDELSLYLALFAEIGCSIFVILGCATRLVVIPLIITMLVAVFVIHAADPFVKQEMGLHYLLIYVMLLLTGAGRYSIDYLISKR